MNVGDIVVVTHRDGAWQVAAIIRDYMNVVKSLVVRQILSECWIEPTSPEEAVVNIKDCRRIARKFHE